MIARLQGKLEEKSEGRVVVDVQGVGYGLFVPETVVRKLPELGAIVTLQVHTHVREDHIILYGFSSRLEQDTFEILMSASGVGAKTALAILSNLEADQLLAAVAQGNKSLFAGITGVGKKTIEKLFVEIQEKAAKRLALERGEATSGKRGSAVAYSFTGISWVHDLEQALLGLGYRESDVTAVVREMAGKPEPISDLDSALRYALTQLSRGANKSMRGNA